MNPEKFFLSPSFENIAYFEQMSDFLQEHIIHKIEKGRPTLSLENTEYRQFLKDRTLPYEGKDWQDVFLDYSKMFQDAVIWQSPGAMINITPPVNMASIIASFWASLFNPNFAGDESAGFLLSTELLSIKYLAQLVGWETQNASGIFTFGGKATNMYAAKIGLQKAFPNINKDGISVDKCIVFTSDKSHPCHKEICAWIGLGTEHIQIIPTDDCGYIMINILEEQLRKSIENHIRIGCIFLNGGTTNDTVIDPIKDVVLLRNRLVSEYSLDYIPHIHVDAVIGWCWLFFKDYDFCKNDLKMKPTEIKKIRSLVNKINDINLADSFGADFHKTGFCPYVSSVFMIKDGACLDNKNKRGIKDYEEMKIGEYAPFEYSLELTRSSNGAVAAFIAMEVFGVKGFRKLIYSLFSSGENIRRIISEHPDFEIINDDTEGFATLFVVHPPYAKERYIDIINSSQKKVKSFIDYNQQFFLFVQKAYREQKMNSRITFSRSFKAHHSKLLTGALKIFPMAPFVHEHEWQNYIYPIFDLKREFDKTVERIPDFLNRPKDMVYE